VLVKECSAGGGINWLSGESLLVLAGPVVVLPMAWIAWRMIRKSYWPDDRPDNDIQ
jgi:hypothetical protein